MAHWPSQRIVRVKVDTVKTLPKRIQYPLKVVSLEPSVDISNGVVMYSDARDTNGFYIAGLEVITLYKTRRQAEKAELKKLQDEYAAERKAVRTQAKRYKWALKRVQEFKAFKQVQTPFFSE